LKIGWGTGIAVSVLLSAAAELFGLVNLTYMLSLILLLSGLWTLVAGLTIVEPKYKVYYIGWGTVVAVLSLFAFLPAPYAGGLVLLVVVVMILLTVYWGLVGKTYVASTQGAPSAGGRAPAAE
jgi:hypothetical protein